MGRSHSKIKVPNNPFEMDRYKREMYDKKYREVEKHEKKKKKVDDKSKRKLENFKMPEPPHVPRKSELHLRETNYDVLAKNRMQDQLARDAQTFVLNQLMLSIQFYGNYKREMREAVERNRKLENEETNKIEQHCKIVILPDRLHEAIDRRVKYRARHGPQKGKVLPLKQQTIYVVHENIEITNAGEPAVYSIVSDAPLYKMEIDVPNSWLRRSSPVGFVRLKSSELIRKQNYPINLYLTAPAQNDSIDMSNTNGIRKDPLDSDEEEELPIMNSKYRDSILLSAQPKRNYNITDIYSTNSGNNYLNAKPAGMVSSNSTSSPSPTSSEYDYAYVTALNTRQPLSAVQLSASNVESFSTTTLPDMCISNIPIQSVESNENESNSEEQETSYEVKQYLNSRTFLEYFVSIFQEKLAADLGISTKDLSEATRKGPIIYTSGWEIVPAIACPWPKEAFEWMHRQRAVKEHRITRKRFQWPQPEMINKVVSFGCHVIPMGFTPKNGLNAQADLEWKIVFPEAERYLESCLTNTQTKVYMITRALLKTFFEPYVDSKYNTFSSEHLRTHLFWQCENNFAAWPEDYLGEALIRFLHSLLDQIKKQRLPDYFLPKRNLFENISERVLAELHKRIFRITENPVMHLMVAVKNLKFYPGIFPKFNYKKLYTTFLVDNPLKLVNPLFRTKKDGNLEDSDESDFDDDDDMWPMGPIGFLQRADRSDKKRRIKRVKFAEVEKQVIAHGERRPSVESIDVKLPIDKHLEHLRRVLVYEIFIGRFIEMAKMSFKFQDLDQSLIYLTQASRLCSLLLEDDRPCEAFVAQIESIHHDVMSERNRDHQERPQLPRRESTMEISSKIKFRIKMSRTNTQNIEDPYTNIDFIKKQMQQVNKFAVRSPNEPESDEEDSRIEPVEPNKYENSSPKFNRYLTPPAKPQVKRQKSHGTTTVQVHAKQSPKSPRSPIKCVNFFDHENIASENNSPVIHISQCGDDGYIKGVKQIESSTIDCVSKEENSIHELLVENENIKNEIKGKYYWKTDLIEQSDSGIEHTDHTEL